MPIQITSNTTLFQHAGGYLIVICGRCHHRRDIPVRSLVPLIGWETALRKATPRFRCSACQAHEAQLSIGYDSRPRGWTKHPS